MTETAKIVSKHKLAISFLLIILIFILIGSLSLRGQHSLGELTKSIYHHPLVVSNASLNAALDITKMHRSMKDVVLADSQDDIEQALKAVAVGEKAVYQQFDTIRDTILGVEGMALEEQARQLFVAWKPIRESVVKHMETGNLQAAIRVTRTNGAAHVGMLENKMLELTSYARARADDFIVLAEKEQLKLEKIGLLLTLLGVLSALVIAFAAVRVTINTEKILRTQNSALKKALDEIENLREILPICSYCRKVRNDEGYYEQIEGYITKHSAVDFSHTICPDCMEDEFPDLHKKMVAK